MTKKKTCSCGRIIGFTEICQCRLNSNRNEYQRNYYKNNKDILKPLRTKRWKMLRSQIIHRDGSICQRCYIKYGLITSANLEVHHIKPRIDYPELIFDETNLLTLCKTCNLQIGLKELDFVPKDNSETDYDFKL